MHRSNLAIVPRRPLAAVSLGAALVLAPLTGQAAQPTATPPPQPATPQTNTPDPAIPKTTPPATDSSTTPDPPNTTAVPKSTPSIPEGLTRSGTAPKSAPNEGDSNANLPKKRQKIDPSISPQEIRRRFWVSHYRPSHNPFRFQGTVRAGIFAGGQSKFTQGGRGGGIEIETGFTRNHYGLSLALGTQFGRFYRLPLAALPLHPEVSWMQRDKHPGYKTPASFSAGLRAGIGRLALQGSGFIDPRIGYEFTWIGVKKFNGYRPTKLATAHGPSLRVDAGFVSYSAGRTRQFQRVFGASLGWNMTVGGIGTKVPVSHYLFLGVFAQMN